MCFELIEVPTALQPCGHEFCRACIEAVVKRAKRGAEVACPLCRTVFYDGATKTARLEASVATRHKLKTTMGTCHCGERLPLSSLRDHLRKCGDPAVCYQPRAKFGHTFAKPDFPKAARDATSQETALDAPSAIVAAMIRRFDASAAYKPRHHDSAARRPTTLDGHSEPAEETPDPSTPREPPLDASSSSLSSSCPSRLAFMPQIQATPSSAHFLPSSQQPSRATRNVSPAALEATSLCFNSPTDSRNPAPSSRGNASPVASANEVVGSNLSFLIDEALQGRSLTKAPAWGGGQDVRPSYRKPPSVHDILAEEESKKQALAERLSSPWSGAVARHLRQTAPTDGCASMSDDRPRCARVY